MSDAILPRSKALGALTALAATSMLAACKKPALKQSILVAGSTTMHAYFEPVAAEFMKQNPAVSVVCQPGGATAGMIALKRGAIDVATLARDVTSEEDDDDTASYLIARDGIALIAHPSTTLTTLSQRQVQSIYVGGARSWKEVGGADAPIVVFSREKNARSRKSFEDLVLDSDDLVGTAREANGVAGIVEAVKSTPGSIGYLPLRALTKEVKTLAVDGVDMTRPTVLSGRYPYARSFYLAIRKPPPVVEKFVEWVLSKDGQNTLHEDGLIPVY